MPCSGKNYGMAAEDEGSAQTPPSSRSLSRFSRSYQRLTAEGLAPIAVVIANARPVGRISEGVLVELRSVLDLLLGATDEHAPIVEVHALDGARRNEHL